MSFFLATSFQNLDIMLNEGRIISLFFLSQLIVRVHMVLQVKNTVYYRKKISKEGYFVIIHLVIQYLLWPEWEASGGEWQWPEAQGGGGRQLQPLMRCEGPGQDWQQGQILIRSKHDFSSREWFLYHFFLPFFGQVTIIWKLDGQVLQADDIR